MKKALLLLLLPLLLASCSFDNQFDELVICYSLPLDSGNDQRAVSMKQAIDMAIEEKGSAVFDSLSYPLRHVPMDDTIPETGSWDTGKEAENARAAIKEHDCIAYIGTFNSGAAKIAIPILNRVQMAMISPGNTYPGLTKPNTGIGDEPWIYSPLGPNKRNFCRVVPADDLQAPAAAQYAAEKLGVKKVFIFHDAEVYGKGLADIFTKAAGNLNIDIVGNLAVGRNASAEDVANQILNTNPDLVYFGGSTQDIYTNILRNLRTLGYDKPFMGADGIAERDFLEKSATLGDANVFATLVGQPLEELPQAGQEWIKRYESRYNAAPDPFAAPSYEAALVVLQAIEQATVSGNVNDDLLTRARPAVLNAMKQTNSANFNSILPQWSFDPNCDTTDTTITINRAGDQNFELEAVVQGQ